jgi:hypothetical protein
MGTSARFSPVSGSDKSFVPPTVSRLVLDSRPPTRQRLKFLWQDVHSIVQIALALKRSAWEVEKVLILAYAVPARQQAT